ncbi:LOW QUALITY PROTEIN: hypothetical protein YC2023_016632 [Brassica napus]
MNGEGESALKSSALRPAVYDSTGIIQGLIQPKPLVKYPRNPADKVHSPFYGLVTYPFSDFGTGWTLPKLVLSGRVNSIINAWRHSRLPSPFRTYPKHNPVLLGREYLNRANHSVDIFTSEQNN